MKRWNAFVMACSADASTSTLDDVIREFVAGRAVDRPVVRQVLRRR